MKYYFAPMEGITGYLYRNAHRDFFEPADKYFSPFLVPKPKSGRMFGTRELADILPEHNRGICLVPQILSCRSEDFIRMAKALEQLGYREVNLNLGCPSRTVVSKGRGSGFLAFPDMLERFLDEVFSALDLEISIKTRIGRDSPEEFEELLAIYNRFPLKECIIHPRTQAEYYKGIPHMDVFRSAWEKSVNPVCYNGDLFCSGDCERIVSDFPEMDRMMLGRGLLANPGLLGERKHHRAMDKKQFQAFHDRLLNDYLNEMSGDKNTLFKMKEFWYYAAGMFTHSESYAKKIRKTQSMSVYLDIIKRLFEEQELVREGGFAGK